MNAAAVASSAASTASAAAHKIDSSNPSPTVTKHHRVVVDLLDSSSDEEEQHGTNNRYKTCTTTQNDNSNKKMHIPEDYKVQNNDDDDDDEDDDDDDDEVQIVDPPPPLPPTRKLPETMYPIHNPYTKHTNLFNTTLKNNQPTNVSNATAAETVAVSSSSSSGLCSLLDDSDNNLNDEDSDNDRLLSGCGWKTPMKNLNNNNVDTVTNQSTVTNHKTPTPSLSVKTHAGQQFPSSCTTKSNQHRHPHAVGHKTPLTAITIGTGDSWNSTTSRSVASITKCPTDSMVVNPYLKNKGHSRNNTSSNVPSCLTLEYSHDRPSSPPGVCYPQLRERTKLYPDRRPNIVLALWKYAKTRLVHDSYNQMKLDQFITKLVHVAIHNDDYPIRSMGEYAFRKSGGGGGGGAMTMDSLQRLETDLQRTGLLELTLPVDICNREKRFFSICEACLYVMKEETIQRWRAIQQSQAQSQPPSQKPHDPVQQLRAKTNSTILFSNPQRGQASLLTFPSDPQQQTVILSQKEYWFSLETLIPKIDQRLRPECPGRLGRTTDADNGAAFYLQPSTKSAEFRQIEKLLSKHAYTQVVDGVKTQSEMPYIKSHTIKGQRYFELTALGYQKAEMISMRTFPAALGHYRTSNLSRVEPRYNQICLAVDSREGGGGTSSRKTLHEMCNTLDLSKIPYFVGPLAIGDYAFFSGNRLCPILVERKSVQDVAQSIHDGRWESQKRRMYRGKTSQFP
jgi:hypothetical protein